LILTGRLAEEEQEKARKIGLILAMVMHIGLLFCLSMVMQLTAPFFALLGQEISGRDLILIGEGLEMHIPKGYIYFAMGFSAFVEILNIKLGRKSRPMKLQGSEFEGAE